MTMMNWQQDDRFAIRSVGGDASVTLVIPVHQGVGAIVPTVMEPGYYRCHCPDGAGSKTLSIKHQVAGETAPTAAAMSLPAAGVAPVPIEVQPSSIRFLLHVSGAKTQISAYWDGAGASTLIMTKVGPPGGA